MKRIFSILFFVLLFSLFAALTVSAETKQVTYKAYDKIIQNVSTGDDGSLVLAPAPDLSGVTGLTADQRSAPFLGWLVQTPSGEDLLPANSSYRDETEATSIVITAFCVNVKTLPGAALSLTESNTLRFDATLAKADYEKLTALVGAENVRVGFLTAPYGKTPSSGPVLDGGIAGLTDHAVTAFRSATDTLHLFSATVDHVTDSAVLEKFSARAYLSVTFHGATRTVYAPYNPKDNARSVHGVAACAYEDAAHLQIGIYQIRHSFNDIEFYSPYTVSELETLRVVLDRVVYVTTAAEDSVVENKFSVDNINFKTYAIYTTPYRISDYTANDDTEFFTVRAYKGGSYKNITAYFIGGSYRPPKGTEQTENGYVITLDTHTHSY